jgi:hypothetical protein
MLKQGNWSDSIGTVMSGLSGGQAPQDANQSLLGSLFGNKLGPVRDFIANRCGVRGSSVTSLLGMAAPLVMGALKKEVSTEGLNPAGLSKSLGAQAPFLKDAMPSGLADTLGIGGLLSGSESKPRGGAYTKPVEPEYRESLTSRFKFLKWIWVPILVLAAGWFFARYRDQLDVSKPGTEIVNRAAPKLSFANLALAPGGVADTMAKAISSGDLSRSISLEGLGFDGTGALPVSAQPKIKEIGAVLASAPNVKIQITGYGDTEESGLSRANMIKSSVASTGVSADRISTRGQTGSGMPTIHMMQQ